MAPKLVHLLLRAAYADRPDWPAGVVFLGPFRDNAPRPGEHPSTHEERKVVTGLHPNGDGGRPTPGFNRRGVGQSHDLWTRRMTSGELLKYRNELFTGLLIARSYHGQRRRERRSDKALAKLKAAALRAAAARTIPDLWQAIADAFAASPRKNAPTTSPPQDRMQRGRKMR